jgi:VWFA-related protein
MKNLFATVTAHALLLAALAPPAAAGTRFARPGDGLAPRRQARPATPQQQRPSPAPPAEVDEDEVVRITTNLVQVDAVVLDKEGKQVTGLRVEDFEVLEDGKPQAITNFSYVDTRPAAELAARPAATPRPGEPAAPPPGRARREQVRRTIAVVVDDLGMAFENVAPARRALRKFIDERVEQGDLVAVIRTGGEVGALQQFTTDKRQMRAAVERVRWNPCSRRGITSVATIPAAPPPLCSRGSVTGTLNVLLFTVEGMRELPGRKSLILFSDSLPLRERDDEDFLASGLPSNDTPLQALGRTGRQAGADSLRGSPETRLAERLSVVDPIRRVGELAVRASVVIYGIDTRGLQTLTFSAADQLSGMSQEQLDAAMEGRRRDDFEARQGPGILTEQTGGFHVRNSNDIPRALGRIMEDLRGYYLLGYRPRDETFDRRFHRISVRVRNRPDLNVRSRRGFYGLTEEPRPATRTAADRINLALVSPFSAGDIDVQLTPIFAERPDAGPFLRALLHIDAGGLTFTPEADGWEKSDILLRGVLFGDNGRVVDEHKHAFTLRMRGETLRRIRRDGLDYTFNVPARKPGAYQFRVAVLDRASSRVGSAGQFVEVPDLKKNRLAVSGIIVGGVSPAEASASGGAAPASAGDSREGAAEARADPAASPSVRRFRQNTLFDYGFVVYNARAEKGGWPRLLAQTRLYRDGRPVFTGDERPIPTEGQTDPKRVLGGGRVSLGTELPPGEYVLQVTVRDALARGEHATATQWIDFEVVK